MKKRLSTLLICLMCCALTACLAAPALALVFTPPGEGGAEGIPEYNIELGNLTIGAGEELSYTVVDSQFETDEAAGIYAGKLNITITGPIVIKSGGSLFIGPIAIGGTEERTSIKAALSTETPLITVEAGGQLNISCADVEIDGTFIKQEQSGLVTLTGTTLPEGSVEWAGAVVDNSYAEPDDVYLEVGTPLTPELLPQTLSAYVMEQGKEQHKTFALSWELG